MAHSPEKVKDLVEVKDFLSLRDFYADPSETLRHYRFTDITSSLLAGWLDALASIEATGTKCRALAGYRGVGKSHFISLFGALAANPELRAAIDDPHVKTSAESLFRRKYPVVNVLRGSGTSFVEELRRSVAERLQVPAGEIPENIRGMLAAAQRLAGDSPLVVLVDTAPDRSSRVSRDDGPVLAELASAAAGERIFVAVALDDDITNADGVNSAIVDSFAIDYLDHEHLYRIVEKFIFPKKPDGRQHIESVYGEFRGAFPGFKWSLERFSSLYPLHPLILEAAPVVRLFAPDFALLSFASEAGNRILGRPAASLIGIDEVFDKVERTLRAERELTEAFRYYDEICERIPAIVPVAERLKAKLVLKALFVFSIDEAGSTADEMSAAVMTGGGEGSGTESAERFLQLFSLEFPEYVRSEQDPDGRTRFTLRVSGRESISEALAEAAGRYGDNEVEVILRRLARDRFPDWPVEGGNDPRRPARFRVEPEWRGCRRPVEVVWQEPEGRDGVPEVLPSADIDLEIRVALPSGGTAPDATGGRAAEWRVADILPAERTSLLKLYAITYDDAIRGSYSQHIAASTHALSVAGARIFDRVFLTESVFAFNGREMAPPEAMGAGLSLADFLSYRLDPVLGELYPGHPSFGGSLRIEDVSELAGDLFSGARTGQARSLELAKKFAEPLGLVASDSGQLVPAGPEALVSLGPVAAALTLISDAGTAPVPLEAVAEPMGSGPFGLRAEARFLVLSAMVAAGCIEFVTASGDRINSRSLDLGIIWDDIVAVVSPRDQLYSSARLVEWARIFTGDESIHAIASGPERERLKEALADWKRGWDSLSILERFDDMPSEELNTKAWTTFASVERAFSPVAEAVSDLEAGKAALEDCLQRIAAAFSDSEEDFAGKSEDLGRLIAFTEGAALRDRVMLYLSMAEHTGMPEIDQRRKVVGLLLREAMRDPAPEANEELASAFEAYRRQFSEFFIEAHDRQFAEGGVPDEVREVLKSGLWTEFGLLSSLPILSKERFSSAARAADDLTRRGCVADLASVLAERPFCDCSFRLSDLGRARNAAEELVALALETTESYKRTLSSASEVICPELEKLKEGAADETAEIADRLIGKLRDGIGSAPFGPWEISLLYEACRRLDGSVVISAEVPEMAGFVDAEELESRLDWWTRELPRAPLLIDLQ